MRLDLCKKSLTFLSMAFLIACSPSNTESTEHKNTDSKTSSASENLEKKTEAPKIWPEDDSTKTGTPVLGFKLGDSTFESVTRQLQGWDDIGTNSYNDGKMIATNGNGYGIDHLQKVTYIFSTQNTLDAVLIQIDNRDSKMDNEGFKKFKGYIAKNGYQQISNQEPFVGNQYAEFKTPSGNIIEVGAPHLSFDLNINYQTAQFAKQYQQKSQQAKTEKINTEAAQF